MEMASNLGFREKCARWLLFLTFIHTIPVIWLTPVAGGTAPTIALLAFGIASLFTFDAEGIGLGLYALLPALLFTLIAWVLAWVVSKFLYRIHVRLRLPVLTLLVAAPFSAVYFPIYVAGGHNSSTSASLIDLFGAYLHPGAGLLYWTVLHLIVLTLLTTQFLAQDSKAFRCIQHGLKPSLDGICVTFLVITLYTNYAVVLCRPFAELGNTDAQVCVAKHAPGNARHWYERAAKQGNAEAITWLVNNTHSQSSRLSWLRKGAAAGHPDLQYQLAKHLQRWSTANTQTEVARWLESAAAAGHGPAQFELAAQTRAQIMQSQSRALLPDYRRMLAKAAQNSSRLAKFRLAEHYARGSMGYPIDMTKANLYYQELSSTQEVSAQERALRITVDTYATRLQQLDRWQTGLEVNDQDVVIELAKLYLQSPLPGPGVRNRGMQLFEQLAEHNAAVRSELIVMLRTGSDGADKNLPAAKRWLLKAAHAGDIDAMDRVARNYMKGREGFPVDYPKARSWTEALLSHYQTSSHQNAAAKIAGLEAQISYFDRLDKQAGGELLGEQALEKLAQQSDATSKYQYALQLMAGQGTRRTEAVEALQAASELGHGDAAWRLVQIYERGFPSEINPKAARRELERAAQLNHFYATRELAQRYEYGKQGYRQNLPLAIQMYEDALRAGKDNRYNWNLDPNNFNHFRWLESRLHQAKLKLNTQLAAKVD